MIFYDNNVEVYSRKTELAGHTVEICRIMKNETVLYYRFKRLDVENSAKIKRDGVLFDCNAFFIPVPKEKGKIYACSDRLFEDFVLEAMYIAYCVGANIIKLPPMDIGK